MPSYDQPASGEKKFLMYTEGGGTAESLQRFKLNEMHQNSQVYLRTSSGNIYLIKYGVIQESKDLPPDEHPEVLKVRIPVLTRDDRGFMAIDARTKEERMLTDEDVANGEIIVGQPFIMSLNKASQPGKKLQTSPIIEIVSTQYGAVQIAEDLKKEGRIKTTIDQDFANSK